MVKAQSQCRVGVDKKVIDAYAGDIGNYVVDLIKNLIADPKLSFKLSTIDLSLMTEKQSAAVNYICEQSKKNKPLDILKIDGFLDGKLKSDQSIINDIDADISAIGDIQKTMIWNITQRSLNQKMLTGDYGQAHTLFSDCYRKMIGHDTDSDQYLLSTVIEETVNKTIPYLSLDWGICELNDLLKYCEHHFLMIMAGRPRMGKTSFAINLALKNYKKKKIIFFSLEQRRREVAQRFMANSLKVSLGNIQSGNLNKGDLKRVGSLVKDLDKNFVVYDDVFGIDQILNMSRQYVFNNGNEAIIFIDFLQLITHRPSSNRNLEVEGTTILLKQLAKELNVPVIVLSQLSREVEGRDDKRPMLSDLRDSGSIEQNSDIIIFPFRPAAYQQEGNPNEAHIIVAKNKNGPIKTVPGFVDLQTQSWGAR